MGRRRPAGAGRARHRRAIDPDHRRCGARRCGGDARSKGSSRRCRASAVAARVVARFRRGHPGRQARRRGGAHRRHRARASGNRNARCRTAGAKDPQCRRDLPRQPHAGSHRRLCGGLEPRAADGALGALLVGPRRARLHEAHLDPAARRRSARQARPGGDRARRGRRASTPMPARSRCGSIRR